MVKELVIEGFENCPINLEEGGEFPNKLFVRFCPSDVTYCFPRLYRVEDISGEMTALALVCFSSSEDAKSARKDRKQRGKKKCRHWFAKQVTYSEACEILLSKESKYRYRVLLLCGKSDNDVKAVRWLA